MTKIQGWHFTDGWQLRDGQPLVVGKTYSVKGPLVMCEWGLHLSRRLIDALWYATGSVISRVEGWGDVIEGDDKDDCRHRTVLAAIDGERLLHYAACKFATDALHIAGVTDKRCWDAIRTKRRWLKGKATDEELTAARSAAWVAAQAAAWDAAWDAARAAGAAWAAAWVAARSAVEAAARDKQNRYLTRMVEMAMAREGG